MVVCGSLTKVLLFASVAWFIDWNEEVSRVHRPNSVRMQLYTSQGDIFSFLFQIPGSQGKG